MRGGGKVGLLPDPSLPPPLPAAPVFNSQAVVLDVSAPVEPRRGLLLDEAEMERCTPRWEPELLPWAGLGAELCPPLAQHYTLGERDSERERESERTKE